MSLHLLFNLSGSELLPVHSSRTNLYCETSEQMFFALAHTCIGQGTQPRYKNCQDHQGGRQLDYISTVSYADCDFVLH